jgi:microcystin-dependent protein
MADPFVAEIRIFGFNFAPTGWALCNGQILPISQNTALFSLLGTTYGGNGQSTFALPNMQGNAPMHPGQGPGLSLHDLGEQAGEEFVTLLESEIPAHSHALQGVEDDASFKSPANMLLASGNQMYLTPAAVNTNLAFQAIAPAGGSLPHNNMMPYLTLNFCIALQGVFPPRT